MKVDRAVKNKSISVLNVAIFTILAISFSKIALAEGTVFGEKEYLCVYDGKDYSIGAVIKPVDHELTCSLSGGAPQWATAKHDVGNNSSQFDFVDKYRKTLIRLMTIDGIDANRDPKNAPYGHFATMSLMQNTEDGAAGSLLDLFDTVKQCNYYGEKLHLPVYIHFNCFKIVLPSYVKH